MTIRIICNKCSREFDEFAFPYYIIKTKDSKEEHYGITEPYIHLCVVCTYELRNWLKGEPIPKQTTTT